VPIDERPLAARAAQRNFETFPLLIEVDQKTAFPFRWQPLIKLEAMQ
jgi:hypothetical protein